MTGLDLFRKCCGNFLFYFIYWAQIKMNIHDRCFARKCKINTMLREYTFYNICWQKSGSVRARARLPDESMLWECHMEKHLNWILIVYLYNVLTFVWIIQNIPFQTNARPGFELRSPGPDHRSRSDCATNWTKLDCLSSKLYHFTYTIQHHPVFTTKTLNTLKTLLEFERM